MQLIHPEEIKYNTFYQEADRILLAVDCIIFGFDKNILKLLLFKRKVEPFKDEWSLIGRFIKEDENISQAAEKVLEECTGLNDLDLEQLFCYGNAKRDPGGRVVSISYYALIRLDEQKEQSVENYHAHWFDVNDFPDLNHDHNDMIKAAFEKLKQKARVQPIGFELLPEKFTIPNLQALYEAIYQVTFDGRNFRKKILSMGILEKLDEKDKASSKKGAFLYQFNQEKYKSLLDKGFGFEL